MKLKTLVTSIALAAVLASPAAKAQTMPSFSEGDRVVFCGDSITEGGRYYSYVWLYYMTRFPEMKLWMANAGVGGDTVYNIIRRFDWDVTSMNPTILTVSFGMNDTGYYEYLGDDPAGYGQKRLDECERGWKELEAKLQALSGVKIVLFGGSPYDEGSKFNDTCFTTKNSWIVKINEMMEASAKANGWDYLDFNAPLVQIASEQQAIDPKYTISRGDRIHPDNDNHMAMAYEILKAQNFGGHAKVADVAVDAAAAKVTTAEHCEISALESGRDGVSFDYLADALPYPLDTIAHDWGAWKSQAEACKIIPLMKEMNSEMVTVKGLEDGRYYLKVDGVELGIFSAAELGEGVNMAACEWAPQYRQALAVMQLNEYRYNIEQEFRHYSWIQNDFFLEHKLRDANDARAIKAYDIAQEKNGWLKGYRQIYDALMNPDVNKARMDEQQFLIDRIYEINKPVKRHIEVVKVNDGKGWAIGPFTRVQETPAIAPDPSYTFDCPMSGQKIGWMESDTFNPAAVVRNGKMCVLFRAEDNSHPGLGMRTSRIGLAETTDGKTFKIHDAPVLFPRNDDQKQYDWEGGCEDPRVAKTADGTYVMFYTSWNRQLPRLCIATSKDLVNWEKHGPAFAKAYDGKFLNMGCKSGSVVTTVKNGELVITKVNGKYLMYWGELYINLATSDDLINWYPTLDENGELLLTVTPRDGKFDSGLTECGPPAILTDKGIVLMYNGQNSKGSNFDPKYTIGTYSAGQILFDKKDPLKILDRLDEPFFQPQAEFEKSGQYPQGTVFIEGLALYKKNWYLYYGCADSFVGVATAKK